MPLLLRCLLAATVLLTPAFAIGAGAAAGNPLELKRAILSTGGVGYFEYEVVVDGAAQLPLSVRFDQVDDVLKSLVIYDSRGGVGTISLPGQEPLRETARGLPFKMDALDSAPALVGALRGAEITVGGARPVTGRVLGVVPEETTAATGGRVTRHRVSVLTAQNALRQFVLEDAEQVEFTDPVLRTQISGALAALARNREQERRTLTVSLTGSGRRTVRIGYVVEAPLWKTSYRLTLPESAQTAAGKGLLQGWAIVENLSGADWNGIDLTLVSGNPVTLRQALYKPHFVTRPEVPVDMMARIVPRVDTGAMLYRPAPQAKPKPEAKPRPAAKPATVAPRGFQAETFAAPAVVTATEDASTQVLFSIAEPVRLAAGNTIAIPIVNREVSAERMSFWDGTSGGTHPLAAVRLRNDTRSSLPPGLLTLFERDAKGQASYVGDARLGWFPVGENRLVSFAVDLRTQVLVTATPGQRIATGRIKGGVLLLDVLDQSTSTYTIQAPPGEARTVLVEQPRYGGYRLASPSGRDVEETQSAYRVRARVGAGERREVVMVQERPTESRVILIDSDATSLVAYARNTALSARLRTALENIAGLRQTLDGEQRGLSEIESKRSGIVAEQARIRDNLARVPASSDLHKRYLDTLRQQEDELQALSERTAAAQSRVNAARTRLTELIERTEL